MRLALLHSIFLPFLLLALGVVGDEEDGEEPYASEEEDEARRHDDDDSATSQEVYVMEHGFLSEEKPDWLPRGTLMLSGTPGRGFEARLSDAKEFVELKPQLQPMMTQAAGRSRYYGIRMYSPQSPQRVLQASIPAKLLADHFEDWHDILEVTVGSSGAPFSLAYRVRNTLGLALFDHTQVHITEPSFSDGPNVPPSTKVEGAPGAAGAKGEQPANQSFLRKYWWVILIVLLLVSSMSDDGSGGKGGGGGGRRSSS
jgi:hypothetical protein